eukprot:s1159_g10.t1
MDSIPKQPAERHQEVEGLMNTISKQKAAMQTKKESTSTVVHSRSAPALAWVLTCREIPRFQRPSRLSATSLAAEWYPPRCHVKDLEVGMELEGKRGRFLTKSRGVFIDVGAERDGFLHVNEWRDGFPEEQMFARNVPVPWRNINMEATPDGSGRHMM